MSQDGSRPSFEKWRINEKPFPEVKASPNFLASSSLYPSRRSSKRIRALACNMYGLKKGGEVNERSMRWIHLDWSDFGPLYSFGHYPVGRLLRLTTAEEAYEQEPKGSCSRDRGLLRSRGNRFFRSDEENVPQVFGGFPHDCIVFVGNFP